MKRAKLASLKPSDYDKNVNRMARARRPSEPLRGPLGHVEPYSEKLPDEFWTYVEIDWSSGCWLWEGPASAGWATNPDHVVPRMVVSMFGWPQPPKRYFNTRRVLWELVHGEPPPSNVDLIARCCVHRCVAPRHTVPFSPKDYAEDVLAYDGGGLFVMPGMNGHRRPKPGAQ